MDFGEPSFLQDVAGACHDGAPRPQECSRSRHRLLPVGQAVAEENAIHHWQCARGGHGEVGSPLLWPRPVLPDGAPSPTSEWQCAVRRPMDAACNAISRTPCACPCVHACRRSQTVLCAAPLRDPLENYLYGVDMGGDACLESIFLQACTRLLAPRGCAHQHGHSRALAL